MLFRNVNSKRFLGLVVGLSALMVSENIKAIEYVEEARRDGNVWLIFEPTIQVDSARNKKDASISAIVIQISKDGEIKGESMRWPVVGCGQPTYSEHILSILAVVGDKLRSVRTERWYQDGDRVFDSMSSKICKIAADQGYAAKME